MARSAETWGTDDLDPRKILLDVKNPRIELSDEALQDEIRFKLLEVEDVLDLARSIEKSGGLFYGERIITVVEGGKHVVLEGNRRIAACQMLLDPVLVPSSYALRFPQASSKTKAALRRLSADIAPNREAAEPILTKRHTERGVKPWSPVAKMRRAVRLMDTMPVEEVAQLLGTTVTQVKKLVRPYRLLKYALELKGWTDRERRALEDEKLTTNPYTRLFTLATTKEVLQISFDEDNNIVSALPARVFKEQMKRIVRDFLIPDPETGRARCDTRTNPDEYFSAFENSPEGKTAAKNAVPLASDSRQSATRTDVKADTPTAMPTPGIGARPKTQTASVFFENLECHVQDDNLIKLTREIQDMNHQRMPIAASLLTRALFECALVYKVKKAKRWGELVTPKGREPGLDELLKFSANFENGIFSEKNICSILQSDTVKQAKTYLDGITHLKYQEADARTLESVGNNLRQVIRHILAGN